MSFGIPVRNGLSVSLVSSTFLSSGRRLNPALNLDFLTGGPLDPRITFSRTSQATLVDSTGKLTYAPNNVALSSQDFESTNWTKFQASITSNAAVAPDGTTTADKVIANTTTAGHSAYTNVASAASNYIFSCYAKASEYTLFRIADGASGRIYASYDLSNGTVVSGSTGGTQFISASVTPAGNGWYRCWIVFAGNAFNYALTIVGYPSTGATLNIYGVNYTGDNVSGIFVWGAQLEQVTYQTTPGTYNSTSPKNLLGYTQEFDNAAWTKSNAFVQTNLLTYSEDFTNAAWSKSATTASANSIAAPDGTLTADTLTETATTAGHIAFSSATASTVPYVFSVYFKKGSGATAPNWVQLYTGGVSSQYANFNLGTGVVGSVAVGSTGTITNVGGGWYRCTLSFTPSASGALTAAIAFTNNTDATTRGPSYAGAITSDVFVWGAQLVQGSTAGDYQRTDAAAAAVQYVAPDGSRTADKLVENTAANFHFAFAASAVTTVSGTPCTLSAYLKAGERRYGGIHHNDGTAKGCSVDLQTGTLGTPYGGATAQLTALGDGWYRLSVTATLVGSNTPAVYASNSNSLASYTGDGTSGIYIWGAQLSNSASLDPYVYNPVAAPTSAAYYGPRFDYDPVTLANKGLLIEEQRTNLLRYSEQFDNAVWTNASPNMPTVTSNSIIAPDGTLTADTLTAATGGTSSQTRQNVGATGLTGNFTGSVYLKAGTSTRSRVIVVDSTTAFTVVGDFSITWSGGSATIQSVALGTASLINVGNGWYRCVITGNAPSANASVMLSIFPDTISGTGSVYAYGAQLEAGSFATSYIPTVASQVTRTADVALMQGANFSNWYNQNEGTFSAEWLQGGSDGVQDVISANDGTTSNLINLRNDASSTAGVTPGSLVVSGGTIQASLSGAAISAGSINKFIFAYAANDFAYSQNGATPLTDTSGTVPVVNQMNIGNRVNAVFTNGHIRRIGYYPTRLANAQLQSLTAQSTIPSLSLDFTTQVFNVG